MNQQRRPLASVYADDDSDGAWLVAQTPLEAVHAVTQAITNNDLFVELTLANPEPDDDPDAVRWNGRSVYLRTDRIGAIGPPLDTRDDDDD